MPVKEGATTSTAIFSSLFGILPRAVAPPSSIAFSNFDPLERKHSVDRIYIGKEISVKIPVIHLKIS